MQRSLRSIRPYFVGAMVACSLLLAVATIDVGAYAQVAWSGDTTGVFGVLSISNMSVSNGGNYSFLDNEVNGWDGIQNRGVAAGVLVTAGGVSPGMHYFFAELGPGYSDYTFHYVGPDARAGVGQLMSANIWLDPSHTWYQVDFETPAGHLGPFYPVGFNFPMDIHQADIQQYNSFIDVSGSSNPWSSIAYNAWYHSDYTRQYQATPSRFFRGNSQTNVTLPQTANWWQFPADSSTGGIFNMYCCS